MEPLALGRLPHEHDSIEPVVLDRLQHEHDSIEPLAQGRLQHEHDSMKSPSRFLGRGKTMESSREADPEHWPSYSSDF